MITIFLYTIFSAKRRMEREEEKQREQEQEEQGEKVGILYNEVKVIIGSKQEIIPFTVFTCLKE